MDLVAVPKRRNRREEVWENHRGRPCLKPALNRLGALLCNSLLSSSHYVFLRYLRRQSSLPFPSILLLYRSRSFIQHRSLQPTVPPTQGPSQQPSHSRLAECLDTIRSEFDVLSQDIVHLRNQRDEFDTKGLPSNILIRVHPTSSFFLSSRQPG
jgi:hypothetical protein